MTIAGIAILLAGFLLLGLYGWRRQPPVPLPPPDPALVSALRSHVYKLAGGIGIRNVWCSEKLEAAADYIRSRLASCGYAVEEQSYQAEGVAVSNLIAEKRGTKHPEEAVIVGAHYDTTETPGADDNASAVAGLLELARAFSAEPTARTVRFVAFVNEEAPFFRSDLQGSRVYVRAAKDRGERIVAAVVLEMIGYYTDRPRSQRYPPPLGLWYPSRGNFVAVVGNIPSRRLVKEVVGAFSASSPFPVESVTAPGFIPGVDLSDHRSFWQEGIPAVMITDTAFYRNPNYHRAEDTPETLDYQSMA
ncbi:MAG: M28 family peptidase [Candidatus Aureabacteria bacterium]|nr:M28 family peptidase [Candidatus Auribacterota bacterium]